MYTFLIIIEILASLALMLVVLLQSSKGDGLAGTFGGGGGGNFGTMFGTRRTADFLSKATWWVGGTLLVLALVINIFFLPGKTSQAERESIIQSSQQQQAVPTTPNLPPPVQTEEQSPVSTDGN